MTDRRQGKSDINQTEQRILNWSFDEIFQVLVQMGVKFNPAGDSAEASITRDITTDMAFRMIKVGDYIYLGEARIGEDPDDAVWRVRRLNTSSGNVIQEWADGDGEFNNVFSNYASLRYS